MAVFPMADAATTSGQRIFTPALVAFLLLVGGTIAVAFASRLPAPDLQGAVRTLADGDLDRDERDHMLLRVIELAQDSGEPWAPWAGALAALARSHAEAHARFVARVDAGGAPPAPDQLRWLDLGDPLVGNVLAAMRDERTGNGADARTRWRQVAAQAKLTGHRFAARIAAEALRDG